MGVIILLGVMGAVCFVIGLALKSLSQKQAGNDAPIIEAVNACLPQTQCAQCGYPGCKPYAEAIVREHVAINRCPPGGQATIDNLAKLLDIDSTQLDDACGSHKAKQLAVIDEASCIGCVKCIQACPVDAIIGAPQQMHVVLNDYCTGCELCVAPCPVDCIEMVTIPPDLASWQWPKPNQGRS